MVTGNAGKSEAAATRAPLTSRAQGVAPAGDEALGAGGRAGAGQGDGGHPAADDRRRGQLDQHDVIVQGPAAVAGVADDLGGVDELLIALLLFDVVLSQPHLDAAGRTEAWGGLFSASPSPARGGGVATAQGSGRVGASAGVRPRTFLLHRLVVVELDDGSSICFFKPPFPSPQPSGVTVSRAPMSYSMPHGHSSSSLTLLGSNDFYFLLSWSDKQGHSARPNLAGLKVCAPYLQQQHHLAMC